jgi:phosphomannomutase
MTSVPSCFKAYDVRGKVPSELNPELAYNIGRAFVQFTGATSVAVGRDMRLSGPELCAELIRGLTEQGADVLDIGVVGTEEVYHATFSQGLGGGIMVTASHNPADYNGMKMVKAEARPISADTGLMDIGALAVAGEFEAPSRTGSVTEKDLRPEYAQFLLGQVDVANLKPFKIVTNAGNGCAGLVVDAISPALPFELVSLQHEPDGTFPNGVPNPLLVENRELTAKAVRDSGADFGVAWDGDFDRCFLFDENGNFIESYYLISLIAETLLAREPGAAIVYDPRLTWATVETVANANGKPVQSKSGHAFMKDVMRAEDAVYGGEMSAHHYFRSFAYCDNGNLPWLFIAELMSKTGKSLSQLIGERAAAYPISGEINSRIEDPDGKIAEIRAKYEPDCESIDLMDGIGINFADWRFNLRKSNTEPLVRLNVEAKGNQALCDAKTEELLSILRG